MLIYKDTYKSYSVWELYNAFRDSYQAYPKVFVDVFEVDDINVRQLSLNYYPVEMLSKPTVVIYPDRVSFDNKVWGVTLVEQTDFFIDYDLWMLTIMSTLVVGNIIEALWQYNIVNFRQFVNHLNKWLRVLNKYFPIKDIVEYTSDQPITKIDLSDPSLWLIDVNTVYNNIEDEYEVKFIRRGRYLIFHNNYLWPNTILNDYTVWEVVDDNKGLPSPLYLLGNKKPHKIEWLTNTDEIMQQEFTFAELWFDALLVYLWIQMYNSRLRYSTEFNVYALKINEKWISMLLMWLAQELWQLVNDSSISKWLYHRSWSETSYTLNTSIIE